MVAPLNSGNNLVKLLFFKSTKICDSFGSLPMTACPYRYS